jgi:septal ring factor EnvC (AmiA/AmiB activator)
LSAEERVAQLESAFVTLTELVRSHGERFDTHMSWINQLGAAQAELTAAQANSEQKIAALVDAQIRTEDELYRLAAQVAQTDTRIDRLVEQTVQTDARIDRLVEQSAQTNARLDRLAEVVERLASRVAGE